MEEVCSHVSDDVSTNINENVYESMVLQVLKNWIGAVLKGK